MEWISIKDRLPDNEKKVLVYDKHEGVCMSYLDGYNFNYEMDVLLSVTHWMELPEPPTRVN